MEKEWTAMCDRFRVKVRTPTMATVVESVRVLADSW